MHALINSSWGSFPKFRVLEGPTPIQELHALNKNLGGVKIYVKRDDLTGIGLGGSKLRKLEYLMGDAIREKADHIITLGARQSNHARLTAAVAAKAGLPCALILTRVVPNETTDYTENGNIVLDKILGATIFDLPGNADAMTFAANKMAELKATGKHPYLIPVGGSNALGCLGYADCALEIMQQTEASGIAMHYVIVPNGSSGTHAGLLAGFKATGAQTPHVRSYNVLAEDEDALKNTFEKASATLQLINKKMQISTGDVDINYDYKGTGYGIPTREMLHAVQRLARTEGILLDPVYSGKAFAGLLGDIEKGYYKPGDNVLFIVTGGYPGLFAYREIFE